MPRAATPCAAVPPLPPAPATALCSQQQLVMQVMQRPPPPVAHAEVGAVRTEEAATDAVGIIAAAGKLAAPRLLHLFCLLHCLRLMHRLCLRLRLRLLHVRLLPFLRMRRKSLSEMLARPALRHLHPLLGPAGPS